MDDKDLGRPTETDARHALELASQAMCYAENPKGKRSAIGLLHDAIAAVQSACDERPS